MNLYQHAIITTCLKLSNQRHRAKNVELELIMTIQCENLKKEDYIRVCI